MKLNGKQALITGGNQGLGRSIAEAFLREGASILLCARDERRLRETATALDSRLKPGQRLLVRPCDIGVPSDVDALAAFALAEFPDLEILVNNAGVYGPKGCLEENDWEAWQDAIRINLLGLVYTTRCVLPHMKRRKRGKIINLSGGGATNPLPRFSAYAASKAAVVRFTETLAEETREAGIDVNAIAPGALNTRLLDEVLEAGPGKVGTGFYDRARKQKMGGGTPPEKGADLAVFLASAASDEITGKLLSAVWDPWETLDGRREELRGTDIYTLRRIVPGDRGKSWGAPPQ